MDRRLSEVLGRSPEDIARRAGERRADRLFEEGVPPFVALERMRQELLKTFALVMTSRRTRDSIDLGDKVARTYAEGSSCGIWCFVGRFQRGNGAKPERSAGQAGSRDLSVVLPHKDILRDAWAGRWIYRCGR